MSATNVINRRYQLDTPPGEEIPAGSYLATDLVTREAVSVKLAPFGHPAAQRLEREQNFLKGIRHPSIIQTYEAGRSLDRKQYVVLEHLKAKPLSQVVKESGPLSAERLINMVDQLASAIDAAHAQNIIHGAVCPEHVLLYVDQLGIERCKLSEFGYATSAGDSLRIPPAHPAEHPSPAFMSPEQAQGRPITPNTDIYSLSAVVFFAWTGKPPYEVRNATEAAAMTSVSSPPRISERVRHVSMTPEIDEAFAAALDRRAAERPHSAMSLADTLRNGIVRQHCGKEGLVAAAQGQSPLKRTSARTTAPTAVIRPVGGRVQPAATGPSAFVDATAAATVTAVHRLSQKTIPVTEKPVVIPHPKRGTNFADFRLIACGVLLVGGLLCLTVLMR
jgi:eukaryotic-like serine/threonine-protein kinase